MESHKYLWFFVYCTSIPLFSRISPIASASRSVSSFSCLPLSNRSRISFPMSGIQHNRNCHKKLLHMSFFTYICRSPVLSSFLIRSFLLSHNQIGVLSLILIELHILRKFICSILFLVCTILSDENHAFRSSCLEILHAFMKISISSKPKLLFVLPSKISLSEVVYRFPGRCSPHPPLPSPGFFLVSEYGSFFIVQSISAVSPSDCPPDALLTTTFNASSWNSIVPSIRLLYSSEKVKEAYSSVTTPCHIVCSSNT